MPSLRVLWSKILKPRSVKTSRENYSTGPNTGNRTTTRGASQYMVVGDGADRKVPEANTLIVSTEVRTSTSRVVDFQLQNHNYYLDQTHMQLEQQQDVFDGHHPYYGQAYHHRPDGAHLADPAQPPFGVYTEAYALQTRHQGVWGR